MNVGLKDVCYFLNLFFAARKCRHVLAFRNTRPYHTMRYAETVDLSSKKFEKPLCRLTEYQLNASFLTTLNDVVENKTCKVLERRVFNASALFVDARLHCSCYIDGLQCINSNANRLLLLVMVLMRCVGNCLYSLASGHVFDVPLSP